MPRQKKARVDSASEAVRIAASVYMQIEPPSNVPLEACDLPFFASVIDEFARSEWSAHQLELAAMLARKMADLERTQRELRQTGMTLTTEKGHPVPNPCLAALRMLDTSILAFRRSLSLHARAKVGETRDIAHSRAGAKQLAESIADLGDEDLIAKPH